VPSVVINDDAVSCKPAVFEIAVCLKKDLMTQKISFGRNWYEISINKIPLFLKSKFRHLLNIYIGISIVCAVDS
jgi:hypothetical protein